MQITGVHSTMRLVACNIYLLEVAKQKNSIKCFSSGLCPHGIHCVNLSATREYKCKYTHSWPWNKTTFNKYVACPNTYLREHKCVIALMSCLVHVHTSRHTCRYRHGHIIVS